EAEQESLGRHVALKVLPSSALLNPTYLVRFRREAKAAARLHHTNIVPVFGVGETDGVPFYAMQFIQGEGLDRVLAHVRRLRRPTPPPTPPARRAEGKKRTPPPRGGGGQGGGVCPAGGAEPGARRVRRPCPVLLRSGGTGGGERGAQPAEWPLRPADHRRSRP